MLLTQWIDIFWRTTVIHFVDATRKNVEVAKPENSKKSLKPKKELKGQKKNKIILLKLQSQEQEKKSATSSG